MPRNVVISKENILNAGFDITRKYGITKVSNRELAKYLNCSIRPIYYQFKNSENFLMNYVRKFMIIFIHIS